MYLLRSNSIICTQARSGLQSSLRKKFTNAATVVKNLRFPYKHVDVFSRAPLNGNGLIVFHGAIYADKKMMLNITREMRQYESIFISHDSQNNVSARIFTRDEELEFAGHPILGAAAALHDIFKSHIKSQHWRFQLKKRFVEVTTNHEGNYYTATMEQGRPVWGNVLKPVDYQPILKALNLTRSNLCEGLAPAVVSTGFPYLIIPIKSGLSAVRVVQNNLEKLLCLCGAKETYVLDISSFEGRNWNNSGAIEDIATAGAAGVVAAYLLRNQLVSYGEKIVINQGRFVNRPSQMKVVVDGSGENITSLKVSGDVCMVASGELDLKLNVDRKNYLSANFRLPRATL